ncbi:Na(+)/H(+) exchanger beta-like isoform X3 [Tubulanus polymorphus]|uniref:Na(+)/H(+) exchanger beta-like isoform X3 n=1 Tax=Tubulanus polymorphus TaxID=672921 RepID=UPI003DA6128C
MIGVFRTGGGPRSRYRVLLIAVFIAVATASSSTAAANNGHHGNATNNETAHPHVGIHVAAWNFDYVATPLMMALFIFVVALSKIAYHHANFLSSWIPESCLLIVLGTVVGLIFFFTGRVDSYQGLVAPAEGTSTRKVTTDLNFVPRNFFLFLLPPIILEASYSLHDRAFYDNLGTVLLFAVLGTIINWLLIGPMLYGLSLIGAMGDIDISLVSCLLFSAFIVAVDPVAVIAIFEEIGVNNTLYFLVFGESLLNDAVTIVIYNMMKTFIQMDVIPPLEMFLGFVSFFTVSLGGLAIGLIIGFMASFISKYTADVRVVEPLLMFVSAYLSFLMAELFHFSGIISMIGCGLVQAQYAFHNISHKSHTTIKYFMKMFSTTCEAVIFLYLGIMLVSPSHEWHTGFILWANVLCLVVRFIVVFCLSFLANRNARMRKIDWTEQFILAYGGLRGAISFSLAIMLDSSILHKQMFSTCTITIVLSTVFIQGMTIKPFVNLLNITRQQKKKLSMVQEIHTHVQDHMMAGVEEIVGHVGHNAIRSYLRWINDKYLKPFLQREPYTKAEHIMQMFEKISLKQHFANLPGSQAQEIFNNKIGSQLSITKDGEANGFMSHDLNQSKLLDEVALSNPELNDNPTIRRHSMKYVRKQNLDRTRHLSKALSQRIEEMPVHPELLDNKRVQQSLSLMGPPKPGADQPGSPARPVTMPPSGEDEKPKVRFLRGRRSKSTTEQPGDLKKILSWRPELEIHKKCDKSLKYDDDTDLLHQLHHKQLLTRRMSTRRALSPSSSALSSPATSPRHQGAEQPIPLDPISESSEDEADPAAVTTKDSSRKRKRGTAVAPLNYDNTEMNETKFSNCSERRQNERTPDMSKITREALI